MNENTMNYKGYSATIEYSPEDKCFVGRVLGIRDVIGFHGESVGELEKDFHQTLDFYLDTCKKRGKTPDRPYSGKLNLRMPPEKHRLLSIQAESTGQSINDVILSAIDRMYAGDSVMVMEKLEKTARTKRKRSH